MRLFCTITDQPGKISVLLLQYIKAQLAQILCKARGLAAQKIFLSILHSHRARLSKISAPFLQYINARDHEISACPKIKNKTPPNFRPCESLRTQFFARFHLNCRKLFSTALFTLFNFLKAVSRFVFLADFSAKEPALFEETTKATCR